MVRQALTDTSIGSEKSSLLKSILMRETVNGSLLGHFEEGGARLVAPFRAALTWASSIDHG